jgi:sugar/nucleoside kinase (ribokinase family)
MEHSGPSVAVAGHICLDIIPSLPAPRAGADLPALLKPGALVEIGPAVLSTGGAVSNTGLALHRLGVSVRLLGMIGDDAFGGVVRDLVGRYSEELARGLIVTPDAPTSYTLVLSPPGVDRTFLHCRGANDVFSADDVPYGELAGVRLVHFGYPTVMQRFYADGGTGLETLLRRLRDIGVATSLDMAMPDPATPAGQADWRAILRRVLPLVDVFLPSLDEMLYMLGRPAADATDLGVVAAVADELLAAGAGVVGLKLGGDGLYVRTTPDVGRLAALRAAIGQPLADWPGRELYTPCFRADVAGTTGAGDCTIAGFLAAVLRGAALDDALTAAVAVGGCNVERADALSGVPHWDAVQQRLAAGWAKHAPPALASGWRWDAAARLGRGPRERR